MHWILRVPQDFSLKELIQRSRWLILPPFSTHRTLDCLERVERLTSGQTAALNISQTPAGLHIQVDPHLNGAQTEELSQKTWRMLRLGESFTPFLDRARNDLDMRARLRQGVRFLRGAAFFEDLLKALLLGSGPASNTAQRLAWLVDGLGDPLLSNPTRHAFPTAKQLLSQREETLRILGPELGPALLCAIAYYHRYAEELESLTSAPIPLPKLLSRLGTIPDVEGNARDYLLLALGRYDYIPAPENPVAPAETACFDKWQPWGGLVYWLTNAPER